MRASHSGPSLKAHTYPYWAESTVTWNTQPNTTTIHQVSVDGATQPYQSDPDNSYGMLLSLAYEDPYKILLLASSDNEDKNIRPKLDVYYTIID